jgi:hypothetical protein
MSMKNQVLYWLLVESNAESSLAAFEKDTEMEPKLCRHIRLKHYMAAMNFKDALSFVE